MMWPRSYPSGLGIVDGNDVRLGLKSDLLIFRQTFLLSTNLIEAISKTAKIILLINILSFVAELNCDTIYTLSQVDYSEKTEFIFFLECFFARNCNLK